MIQIYWRAKEVVTHRGFHFYKLCHFLLELVCITEGEIYHNKLGKQVIPLFFARYDILQCFLEKMQRKNRVAHCGWTNHVVCYIDIGLLIL